ncbi:MAG: thiamine-phosphate kinase [Myxococcales bacterium]|nr:MAG: thiamine-phosphate kinase [Myxococcales bacterium]
MKTLASIGEFPFIEAIAKLALASRSRGVVVGIGDDAACLRLQRDAVVTVDTVVEGVHFRREWLSPHQLGRRALRAALSDLSACGAVPCFALLALTLKPDAPLADARGFVSALIGEGRKQGLALVGGNVSAGPVFSATLTLVGQRGRRFLRRDTARAGDAIYVTGPLGGASAGVALLKAGELQGPLQNAFRLPPLRVAAGLELGRIAGVGAVIDVSDGLVQDLSHVCKAAHVSAEIDVESIPLPPALRRKASAQSRRRGSIDPHAFALFGGDDYELLFTLRSPGRRSKAVLDALERAGCKARPIGRIVPETRVPVCAAADGTALTGGFSHFGKRR